jgi:hypothetical protein
MLGSEVLYGLLPDGELTVKALVVLPVKGDETKLFTD